MKIGGLAMQAGCEVQTLRFCEREGQLDAPDRDASGCRRHASRHLQRVQFIRHRRALDIPLPEVRELLAFAAAPDPSCARVDAWLDGHIERVRLRLMTLRALELNLVVLRGRCDGEPARSCAILDSLMAAVQAQADLGRQVWPSSTTRPPPAPRRLRRSNAACRR